MGRCVVTPLVKLHGQGAPSPRLLWYDVQRGDEEGGQILCAFELFLVGSNETDKCSNFMVSSFLAVNHLAVVLVVVISIVIVVVIIVEMEKDI